MFFFNISPKASPPESHCFQEKDLGKNLNKFKLNDNKMEVLHNITQSTGNQNITSFFYV